MKLKVIGPNQTEVETVFNGHPCTVFFSYSPCVAYSSRGKVFVTQKKHSPTTSRHIKAWLKDKSDPNPLPQVFFDAI